MSTENKPAPPVDPGGAAAGDILDLTDVKKLVFHFYDKVRDNGLLSPIFNARIKDQWPEHLEKMVRFWQTVLLETHTYGGSPFPPHANLPVDKAHFTQWLQLFYQSVDELFTGKRAEEAKWRAGKMAEVFLAKIEYYRS